MAHERLNLDGPRLDGRPGVCKRCERTSAQLHLLQPPCQNGGASFSPLRSCISPHTSLLFSWPLASLSRSELSATGHCPCSEDCGRDLRSQVCDRRVGVLHWQGDTRSRRGQTRRSLVTLEERKAKGRDWLAFPALRLPHYTRPTILASLRVLAWRRLGLACAKDPLGLLNLNSDLPFKLRGCAAPRLTSPLLTACVGAPGPQHPALHTTPRRSGSLRQRARTCADGADAAAHSHVLALSCLARVAWPRALPRETSAHSVSTGRCTCAAASHLFLPCTFKMKDRTLSTGLPAPTTAHSQTSRQTHQHPSHPS
eukprot:1091791-Rhodomonas_salina.1